MRSDQQRRLRAACARGDAHASLRALGAASGCLGGGNGGLQAHEVRTHAKRRLSRD